MAEGASSSTRLPNHRRTGLPVRAGTEDKPVGTVHIAAAYAKHGRQGDHGARRRAHVLRDQEFVFQGNREAVRLATVNEALKMMLKLL